ncbi:PAS domain-containing protein [Candidatus Falkowbacteria bacterium]|uniref:histidine kinase n=1 Tax=Candidatus Falkowbacteria bacterium CG10_big_fil_rev_8_21_14_0_10_37_18 TaxID=1974562 RepID=A0A2H0VAV9_9BACT|nr:PAS domain-containing protein [Candidatus Falkowbacteria bacterium]NCQ12769.1 PAS domain-containing protein [Candidatus Falkowbacteria bacterium]OIO06147.1 MAG: hypothetical protein AUJ26_01425 [Candidatus Falkowbacteria bacterium CG1_02_37_21]PIR95450.1 MAG: hypothetical protein COT93_02400 [Candidatus Falkowbacteria bacterium CG10_big_fil_rev_8_21_14_0_10_37_18]
MTINKWPSVLMQLGDPIFELNYDGVFEFINQAFIDLVGQSREEILEKNLYNIFPNDKATKCLVLIQQACYRKKNTEDTFVFNDSQGESYYHIQFSPIQDESGRVISVVGVCRDVTKQYELVKSVENHLYTVHHDLRGPLGVLLSYLELLQEGGNSLVETKDFLDMIGKMGLQMRKMLETYLLLAKIEKGENNNIEKTQKSLHDLIDYVKSFKDDCTHNVEIEYIIGDNHNISINETLIVSAINNLLHNAVEASMPSTRGKITVKAYVEEKNICLSISNEGKIPEVIKKNLFKRFFTTKLKGNGLGLYSAQLIAKAHGGKIICKSEKGITEFVITIPIAA